MALAYVAPPPLRIKKIESCKSDGTPMSLNISTLCGLIFIRNGIYIKGQSGTFFFFFFFSRFHLFICLVRRRLHPCTRRAKSRPTPFPTPCSLPRGAAATAATTTSTINQPTSRHRCTAVVLYRRLHASGSGRNPHGHVRSSEHHAVRQVSTDGGLFGH